tara:strand:+ start:402 stop:2051 length:1650 start_codon:yes stop_codon:yes gene_type:complete
MKLSKLKKIIRESFSLNEQQGGVMANLGVYHVWKHCQTGNKAILYWNSMGNTGFPQQLGAGPNGWSMGMTVLGITATSSGNGGSGTQPWATHQNSEAFWIGMGSPNPGDTVSALIGPQNQGAPYYCWEYVGQNNGTYQHGAFGGGNSISNVLVNDPLCPTDCGSGNPSNDDKCTEKDFQYNSTPCGQTHLVPAPGGAGSWQPWLTAQWNAYSTGVTQSGGVVGCYQFGSIITYITNQLNNGVTGAGVPFNQTQIDRKSAKRDWAVCMANHCDCDINTTWNDDPTDPCKQFNAAPQQLQTGCCGKCINGVYSGISGDQCDTLTNSCKCCDDDLGGEDVRGCLNPAQSGATNIGMPCPGSVGVVNIHYEPCCNYDNTGGDDCKQFYAMPQNYQDGCCEKCQGNISPSDPCYVHCKCCNPRISDDPCKDNPNPECYWCHNESGPSCAPVGGNLAYATNNGFTLYQNAADCNSAEPGCKREEPQMIECHKCANGYPVGNMFPGPNCPTGWTPMAQFNPKDCKPGGPTDPFGPVDMVDPGMERMKTLMEYKEPK